MGENDLQAVIGFFKEQLQGFRDDFKQELSSIAAEIKALNSSVNEIKLALGKVDMISQQLQNSVTDLIKRVTILENCNTADAGEKRGKENVIKFTWLIWGGLATGIGLLIAKWFIGIK